MSQKITHLDRLCTTLKALYAGESIDHAWIKTKFDLSESTSFRDIRLLRNILERQPDGRYQLKASLGGKISPQDVQNLVHKTGISGLHPQTAKYFLELARQQETEQNRTEQNRTEQNRTEQNRTEQNRTEQNRTEQ